MSFFASKTLLEHLLRGAVAAGFIAVAIQTNDSAPLVALFTGLAALLMLRGCPMCWTVGLFEIIARTRNHQSRRLE